MRRATWPLAVILLIGLLGPAQSAQAVSITGKECPKLNSKRVVVGKLYKCVRIKVKRKYRLLWGKGTYCKSATQTLDIGTLEFGCKKSAGKWIWYKKPLIYPTLKLRDDFSIISGGDTDVSTFTDNTLGVSGWQTGNGTVVGAENSTPDSFMNIAVDNSKIWRLPKPYHTYLAISYVDSGTDTFTIQYDSKTGPWASSRAVTKTNTGLVKTAYFNICDGGFQKRNNGGDIRIDDRSDGPEFITDVRMRYMVIGKRTWKVDDYGANPFDTVPDSDTIQRVLNLTCSGDTVVFTSGVEDVNGFKGYYINKTIKLVGINAKERVKFTSSNKVANSLFKATPDLLGFVARLYGKGSMDMANIGKIDNITFERIDIDSNRQARQCTGSDGVANGVDDNWGSSDSGDLMDIGNPGTLPGGIQMDGAADTWDAAQDYINHPNLWTTDTVIQDLTIKNVECGTALGMIYTAKATVQRVTVENSGEHHHVNDACEVVDNDGDQWSWADGMTIGGPDLTIQDNHIINPSDVGIVTFGGKGQKILNNVIETTAGNYGTFAGIHVQVGAYGDLSDLQIAGNTLTNVSNSECGGMHIGIALSSLTFLAGCLYSYTGTQFGSQWGPTWNSGDGCNYDDLVTKPVAGHCAINTWCTAWIHADPGHPIQLVNNTVTGAQVNYTVGLVDGEIVDTNNVSIAPQDTDWQSASNCRGTVITPTDKFAQLPSLTGWTDFGLTCWG